MIALKRFLLIVLLILIGAVDVLIYWNSYMLNKGVKRISNEEKIEILEKSTNLFPLNDLTYYELGKAYFDLGVKSLYITSENNNYFQKSKTSFFRSIKLNPASLFTHFNLAKCLHYIVSINPSSNLDPYNEYEKAVLRSNFNNQIFFEVGKIYLSRWEELSDENKAFALDVLKKIVELRDREKFNSLLQAWALNVQDYEMMAEILVEDPLIYRLYGRFLGERSLSIDERQKMFANAERLEFKMAEELFLNGSDNYYYFLLEGAIEKFESCLDVLRKIQFYQGLTQQDLIDNDEFKNLEKAAYLNLAKCHIEMGKTLEEVNDQLLRYLELEENVSDINQLERYLIDRNLVQKKLGENFENLKQITFQLYLAFKQDRYDNIVRIGRLFQRSFRIIPEDEKFEYVKILKLMGDAFQKMSYLYDAGDFYQQALVEDPENLETLMKIRRNSERLNDEEKIKRTTQKIESLLADREMKFVNYILEKGQSVTRQLVFDGRKILLDIHFKNNWEGISPIVSILFNGKVIWEDYLTESVLSLPWETQIGRNRFQIVSVNRTISPDKITYKNFKQ